MATVCTTVRIRTLNSQAIRERLPQLDEYARRSPQWPLSQLPSWLPILAGGLRHTVFCIEAVEGDQTRGLLPLAYVRSLLFGRFLVSLPYLNTAGVLADDPVVACRLLDQAITLADELNVRYLELRHEQPAEHPALTECMTSKVHMRLSLPARLGELWDGLDGKVRNQVRKGQKCGLQVVWGGGELLPEFYTVFSRNMRDLGTPVYGSGLFARIVRQFPDEAEFCIVRAEGRPVAGALLLHGTGVTEVPSASCLREYNSTCANMFMYWQLLERAMQRRTDSVRLRSLQRGRQPVPLQEAVGSGAVPGDLAVLRSPGQHRRRASGQSALWPVDPHLATVARDAHPVAWTSHRARHPLTCTAPLSI